MENLVTNAKGDPPGKLSAVPVTLPATRLPSEEYVQNKLPGLDSDFPQPRSAESRYWPAVGFTRQISGAITDARKIALRVGFQSS